MWYNTTQEEPINVLECVRLISWENENEKWPNVPFGVLGHSYFTIRTTNVVNAIINDIDSNGKGQDPIMDIQDHERVKATIKLMESVESGRKSGEEQGWISSEQLKNELEILKKWFIKTT